VEQAPTNRTLPQAAWIIIIAVAVLVVVAGYRFLSRPEPSSSIVTDFSAPPHTAASPQQRQAQNKLLESLEVERQAIAKARLLSISQTGEEIEELIAELQTEITTWRTEIDVLLTNEAGRHLTADNAAIQAFQQIYSDDRRVSPGTPHRLRALLQSYMQPVQEALADSARTYSPSDELGSRLLDLDITTREAITSYREPRQKIQSLVSAAAKTERTTPPSLTLAEAIDKMVEQHALEEAQAIAAAVEAERKEHNRKLADLKAKHARGEAERERARKKLEEDVREKEATRQLTQSKAEEKSKAENARLEALRKRAADPAVQANYRPFLAKGRFIFKSVYNNKNYHDIPRPASFRRLRETGVLKNVFVFWSSGAGHPRKVEYGYRKGYKGQGEGNDRPTWSGYPKTEEQLRRCNERFREFLELAPFWIETGVLRP